MTIKTLGSDFKLTCFPERISVQSALNHIFCEESDFIKLKVWGMTGEEEMGND